MGGRRFVYTDCEIVRVLDGDTVDVIVRWDLGFGFKAQFPVRLRLRRINAPETNRRAEMVAGKRTREYVRAVLRERYEIERDGEEPMVVRGQTVAIETFKPEDDSEFVFGDGLSRWPADIWPDPADVLDDVTLSDVLVDEGLAVYKTYSDTIGQPRAAGPESLNPWARGYIRRFNGWSE